MDLDANDEQRFTDSFMVTTDLGCCGKIRKETENDTRWRGAFVKRKVTGASEDWSDTIIRYNRRAAASHIRT